MLQMAPTSTMRQRFCLLLCLVLLSCVVGASSDSTVLRPRLLAFQPQSLTSTSSDSQSILMATSSILNLRGGDQSAMLVGKASDWVGSLAGPASMVSGAVLSNLYQIMRADSDLSIKPGDSKMLRIAKKMTKFLLVSAFTMVLSCIFFSLITRSMLMALPPAALAKVHVHGESTPMSVLRENFEFEYLTCQILIGQGLLNWLGSIALTFGIPRPDQPLSVRKMNVFISTVVSCMMLIMVSFFNNHLIHYPNYLAMLWRWSEITWRKFIWHWPLMPMTYIMGPVFLLAVYRGLDAFFLNSDKDDESLADRIVRDVFG
ncbi:hypothetical protein MPSEU_000030300 [Mayamaea pseudoterrestris]|nr:hypothetical protein MPSEU_000030300 [Mayamaea pseudoterrestris]